MDAALQATKAGFDLALDGDDLKAERGLLTAVAVSLFSDARAPAAEGALDLSQRGWWPDRPGDRWGSQLWMLLRAAATRANILHAEATAQRALAWMVEDQVAKTVTVKAQAGTGAGGSPNRILGLEVRIERGARWQSEWEATGQTLLQLPGGRLSLIIA